MAEETTGDQQAQEPNGEAQQPETDWKAKYEETLAHSREWEKRAKANKTAADELQQLKESQMSEAQKAEARTARLQKELDALKTKKQTNAWRSQIAEESKLPASLVFGATLEEMQASAKAVGEYICVLASWCPRCEVFFPCRRTNIAGDVRLQLSCAAIECPNEVSFAPLEGCVALLGQAHARSPR